MGNSRNQALSNCDPPHPQSIILDIVWTCEGWGMDFGVHIYIEILIYICKRNGNQETSWDVQGLRLLYSFYVRCDTWGISFNHYPCQHWISIDLVETRRRSESSESPRLCRATALPNLQTKPWVRSGRGSHPSKGWAACVCIYILYYIIYILYIYIVNLYIYMYK